MEPLIGAISLITQINSNLSITKYTNDLGYTQITIVIITLLNSSATPSTCADGLQRLLGGLFLVSVLYLYYVRGIHVIQTKTGISIACVVGLVNV